MKRGLCPGNAEGSLRYRCGLGLMGLWYCSEVGMGDVAGGRCWNAGSRLSAGYGWDWPLSLNGGQEGAGHEI